ncbi:MAG: hypothetical protein OXG68_12540 [Chloroflexi bacterium]|nr:hypothetical protein [Chloroflexota bacterium]
MRTAIRVSSEYGSLMSFLLGLTTERAAAIIVSLLLFAMAARVSVDPDMWWHLRLGEHIVESGQPVYTDVFSHSQAGKSHRNHSWLSQVFMHGLWRLAGHFGLTVFVAALGSVGMVFLYRAGRGSIYVQGFVLIFGAACAAAFWSPRPQMLTFFFGAVLVFLLFDLKRNGRDRLRALPLLLWFWGNCHGGYIMGFVLIGAFALGEVTNSAFALGDSPLPSRIIRKLIVMTLLSLALMPLNPLGLDIFVIPFDTIGISGLRQYIQEWQSPDLSQLFTWGFVILLLLLAGALMASRRRLDATECVLLGGSFCLALLSGRNLPFFAIAAVPITTQLFDEALTRRGWSFPRRKREQPHRVAINLILIALVAIGVLLHLSHISDDDTVAAAVSQNWPVEAVRQLNASALQGNLFNSYNWGGYLIFTARQHPVFIDGRTDLHRETLADYVSALGTKGWSDIFEKWDISIALIDSSSYLAAQLEASSAWRREYTDEMASIFVRSGL